LLAILVERCAISDTIHSKKRKRRKKKKKKRKETAFLCVCLSKRKKKKEKPICPGPVPFSDLLRCVHAPQHCTAPAAAFRGITRARTLAAGARFAALSTYSLLLYTRVAFCHLYALRVLPFNRAYTAQHCVTARAQAPSTRTPVHTSRRVGRQRALPPEHAFVGACAGAATLLLFQNRIVLDHTDAGTPPIAQNNRHSLLLTPTADRACVAYHHHCHLWHSAACGRSLDITAGRTAHRAPPGAHQHCLPVASAARYIFFGGLRRRFTSACAAVARALFPGRRGFRPVYLLHRWTSTGRRTVLHKHTTRHSFWGHCWLRAPPPPLPAPLPPQCGQRRRLWEKKKKKKKSFVPFIPDLVSGEHYHSYSLRALPPYRLLARDSCRSHRAWAAPQRRGMNIW